jgi:hypothetical protein
MPAHSCSGEAGIGKPTALELWLARLSPKQVLRIRRGSCAEHFGEGEPYLPLVVLALLPGTYGQAGQPETRLREVKALVEDLS